jgi:RHS repeat-associated protein
VGAWGLNGVFGTPQADYSGNNNPGEPDNGLDDLIPSTVGKFGGALVFGGPNAGLDMGNPPVFNITGSMTLSAWIYSTDFPEDDAAIVSKFTSGGHGFQLDTTIDTGPRVVGFKLGSPLSGGLMARYGSTVIQPNTWYHVAGVYDAAARTMTVYVNGVLDNGVLVGTVATSQVPSSMDVNIGRRPDTPALFNFIGTIDEVRIYNRALSQAEIQTDMNAAITATDIVTPSAPTNLVASVTSPTQVHLQLTNSSDNLDVTAYRVERCLGAGCSNFTEVRTTNSFSFQDAGLVTGASYSYRVRATDGAGNLSGYSNMAAATPRASATGARVGAFAFEEGSGYVTSDASGYGNNGILNGSVGFTAAGVHGAALAFSGGYVDLGDPGTLQMTGSMTVSAWINSSAFPSDDGAVVSKLDTSPGTGWQLDTTVDLGPRTIGFKLANPDGSLMARYGATTLQLNTRYHIAGVYDAQAQTLNVYLNGQLDNGALVGTVTPTQLDSLLDVFIGSRPSANVFGFSGTIDDVRIYSRALAQAEIQADMNAPASAPPADVIAPSTPGVPSANAASANEIDLSWTASTDNVGVTGYVIERCQDAGCTNFVQIAVASGTSFSDTNVAAGTSYSYRVRAIDGTGNVSGFFSVVSVTTSGSQQGQLQGYYIVPDHLNTPRMIADQTGNTVWRWDQQEPFGTSQPNADPDGDGIAFDFPLRFPGQYFDRETNVSYNYRRDYDSSIGRYVESDPIGLKAGVNTYLYVSGKPLRNRDPKGLDVDDCSAGVCGPGAQPPRSCFDDPDSCPPPPSFPKLSCDGENLTDCLQQEMLTAGPACTICIVALAGTRGGGRVPPPDVCKPCLASGAKLGACFTTFCKLHTCPAAR